MGCNEILDNVKAAQKKYSDTQKHFISIYAFQEGDTPSRYLLKNEPAENAEHITPKDYMPCGCTPLLDAVGTTMKELGKVVSKIENAAGSVTIITDGMENSSKEYTLKQVAGMIEQYKEKGWNINFIGANIDTEKVSRSMNIDNSMDFEQSVKGTGEMFAKEKSSRMKWTAKVHDNIACMGSPEDFSATMKKLSKNYFEKDKKNADPK